MNDANLRSAKVSKSLSIINAILTACFGSWKGRKVRVVEAYDHMLYDMNWSGGTRNDYYLYNLSAIGAQPMSSDFEGTRYVLRANQVLVCHSMFCGKDAGMTIYILPQIDRDSLGMAYDLHFEGMTQRAWDVIDQGIGSDKYTSRFELKLLYQALITGAVKADSKPSSASLNA